MIIGTAAERPVVLAVALPDREIVDAGDAQVIEFRKLPLAMLLGDQPQPLCLHMSAQEKMPLRLTFVACTPLAKHCWMHFS
jgi:hypothetical protein